MTYGLGGYSYTSVVAPAVVAANVPVMALAPPPIMSASALANDSTDSEDDDWLPAMDGTSEGMSEGTSDGPSLLSLLTPLIADDRSLKRNKSIDGTGEVRKSGMLEGVSDDMFDGKSEGTSNGVSEGASDSGTSGVTQNFRKFSSLLVLVPFSSFM
jgi:hypothetical protein